MFTAIHDVLMETIRLLTFTPRPPLPRPIMESSSDCGFRPKAVFSPDARRRQEIDEDQPADQRHETDQQPPARHVAVMQAPHADRDAGDQGRKAEIPWRSPRPMTCWSIKPSTSEAMKTNKTYHQYSDRRARPEKLA